MITHKQEKCSMKKMFLFFTMVLAFTFTVYAKGKSETAVSHEAGAKAPERNYDGTGRTERAAEKIKTLISPTYPLSSGPDAEFNTILENYIWGEVFYHGSLTDRERILILLAIATTNQNFEQLGQIAASAIRNDILSPVEVKEAVYQCTPYIGYPKTINAFNRINEILKQQNINLPLERQSTVTEETRFERGLAIETQIFGDAFEKRRENAPENQKHIYDFLSAQCFGDFYTRGGLDVKTRGMLSFVTLVTLGDCENLLVEHIKGNLNIGNDKDYLVEVLTQGMPYMGFPRALNALEILNSLTENSSR
jgi:4-carboxymuconolactone decarboxylase